MGSPGPGDWLPGLRCYRSFQEMMQSGYYQFAGSYGEMPVGVVGELPDEYVGSPGSPNRRIKKRRRPAEPKILNKALSPPRRSSSVPLFFFYSFRSPEGEAAVSPFPSPSPLPPSTAAGRARERDG